MRVLFFMLCMLIAVCGAADELQKSNLQNELERLLAARRCPAGSVGVAFADVERKTMLASVSADSLYNPASVSKLLTAAVALELRGTQHTFPTRLFIDTMVVPGMVRNLYIQGNGDPGFTAERLWLFVEHIYHCGIRKVTGDLVLDDFFFDTVSIGPGFNEDSGSRAYQPLISALAMNFNCVGIHCRPGGSVGAPVAVDLLPEIAGAKISSSAVTAATPRKGGITCETRQGKAGETTVTVNGALGIAEPGTYTFRKLWQTREAFANAIRPLFSRRGIVFTGKMVHARVPARLASRPPFYTFESQNLTAPLSDMFKYSSNFAAEMVFKTLSASHDSTQGSWEKSSALASAWWHKNGLPGTPVIKNGSGMGNCNRMSANQVTALLTHVWEQKRYAPEYTAALSVAGVDGTIKSRFIKSPLKGLVRGKTGTLNNHGISALAGYLLLPGRGPVAFAILCSKTGRTQYEDWVLQEKILEKVFEVLKEK